MCTQEEEGQWLGEIAVWRGNVLNSQQQCNNNSVALLGKQYGLDSSTNKKAKTTEKR